mmetsp:Transcript_4105/g.6028  ORF Transcript_4105/g.6028 Transcript_4105/m.6028 type:complete len:108 (-) Transcript_4105:93-416(-)
MLPTVSFCRFNVPLDVEEEIVYHRTMMAMQGILFWRVTVLRFCWKQYQLAAKSVNGNNDDDDRDEKAPVGNSTQQSNETLAQRKRQRRRHPSNTPNSTSNGYSDSRN